MPNSGWGVLCVVPRREPAGTLLCLWGCQTDLAGCALDAGIITRKASVRDKSSEGGGGVVKVMRGFIRGRHQF